MRSINDGDNVVLHQLDEYIKTTSSQDSNLERKMTIDFSRLESEGQNNCELVKDILRVPSEASKDVLLHPVIDAYIDVKWKATRKYISAHFCIYLAFLLTYSWFLANIFYRDLRSNEYTTLVLSSSDFIQYPPSTPTPTPSSNVTNASVIFSRNVETPSNDYPQSIVLRLRPDLFNQKITTIKDSNE